MGKIRTVIALTSVTSLLAFSNSFAASINTTFSVTANVLSTCSTVTATTLAFGDYNPISGSDKDSTSTIDVTCTNGTAFSIKLNGGVTGIISQRKLKEDSGSHFLNYGLFTDLSRGTTWGDGSSGQVVSDTGTGSAVQETVYGRIAGGQNNKNPGTYSDTITVTVDY